MQLITKFLIKPYFNRVKLGEGGLVVFNLFHSVYSHHELASVIFELTLSFFVMCLLYGFNDYTDRHYDIQNSKKDKNFTLLIIQNEKLFIRLNLLLTWITLLVWFFFVGHFSALLLLVVYLVNIMYSIKLKSIPILDIIAVCLWGGLYVMIIGKPNWALGFIAGTMTGIAHLFQTLTDKPFDKKVRINTTVVTMPGSEWIFISVLCAMLGIQLFFTLGIWWALSGVVPVLVYAISRRVTFSWYVSRAYFFICWITLLISFYGGI
jgi:4-hydroxybenzoate polyprenyltransferase